MLFTVEVRYLPLPTLTTLKVLHLAKKEIHRLTAAHCASYNISLTSVDRIIKYDLQLKCMLVCFRRPLPVNHLIVLYCFLIRVIIIIIIIFVYYSCSHNATTQPTSVTQNSTDTTEHKASIYNET